MEDKTNKTKGKTKGKAKIIYSILIFPITKEKEAPEANAFFEEIQKEFKIFYSKEIEKDNTTYFIKILKYESDKSKKDKGNILSKCSTKEFEYFVVINYDKENFIYELKLFKKNNLYKNMIEIFQNQISLTDKMNIFIESLNQNKEPLNKFYENTIDLYSLYPRFDFLIEIFLKVYEDKKLCTLLLSEFYKFNTNLKSDHKDSNKKNIVLNKSLEKYKDEFNEITKKSNELIIKNEYDSVQFYGLIFCYLNNYEYGSFKNLFNALMNNSKKILYEILLIYLYFFKNPILDNEKFFIDFMEYSVENNTYINFKEKCLSYFNDIHLFFASIDSNKDKIIQMKDFEPIEVKEFDNYTCETINNYLDSILNFSKTKGKLLLILNNSFWENFIKLYLEPTKDNIQKCSDLSNEFRLYSSLISDLIPDKIEINDFLDKSQFEYLLDNNIKKYIEKTKNIENEDIISFIMNYDIYYKDDKYIDLRDPKIFDKINFNTANEKFVEQFKSYGFEKLFAKKLLNFLFKLIEKIEKLSHFSIILQLIDINELNEKKGKYLQLLNNKYENLIEKKDILDNEDKTCIVKALSELTIFFYSNEKDIRFLKNKINKLNKDIKNKIYIQIVQINKDEECQDLKDYIHNIFIENLKKENIEDFILYIKQIEKKDYLYIMKLINERYLIDKTCFFNNKKTVKINLLVQLQKNNLLEFKNENIYFQNTEKELNNIFKDIIKDKILIKEYEQLLSNKEEDLINKLKLLTLVNKAFNPQEKYEELKDKMLKIKTEKDILINIRDSLKKFHKTVKEKQIQEINKINETFENGTFTDYESMDIKALLEEKNLVEKINTVNDSDIFFVFYSNEKETEQNKRFENSYLKLINYIQNENFEDLPELSNINNEKIDKEIKFFMEKFSKNNQNLKKNKSEEKKIINFKKHEQNINSIFYFFENFYNNDKEWEEFLNIKYKNLCKNKKGKIELLKELKEKEIYDYMNQNKEYYIKFFNCLYQKKPAYDFLLNNKTENINLLYNKIEPNNRTISSKEIADTIDCVGLFEKIKNLNNNFEIFKFVKENINEEKLKKFINFSDIYNSIIELNQNFDFSINLYDEVKDIVTNADFIFEQESEKLIYTILDEKKNKLTKCTTIENLKYLKNRIHIKPKMINKSGKEIIDDNQSYNEKYELLKFFKDLVDKIEIIYDDLKILRVKGSSMPIIINIKIEYPKVMYTLKNEEKKFNDIKNFLFNAKNELIIQIDKYYKENINCRFLYSRQFNRINKSLTNIYNIIPFLRYILNNTNDLINIKEGDKTYKRSTYDYVGECSLYIQETLSNISEYINSIFINNNSNLENHYEQMKIKKFNEKYKGIYIYSSSNNSMVKDILYFFLEYTKIIPIQQNILISNIETSYEEMKAFFSRAILCKFNTLFIVEINNSFSDYQQKIMNNLINQLLLYKNELKNESENDNIDKNKTSEYMESCIIFIYKKEQNNNPLILNEIQKLNPQILSESNERFDLKENKEGKFLYENTHILRSTICGLGKSTKIKKEIAKKRKKYIYFPLGGNLTKNSIFRKLDNIMNKIKTKNYYKDYAIHLDLFESKETSILNEFLFSFLITKFYLNNEDIIYIPKNLEIFIEIPNCFHDFLSDYDIFNSFEIETITMENKPEFDLPNEKNDILRMMLDSDSNDKIYNYIISKMDLDKFSYHQSNIFVNLFIGQYNKFQGKKLKFLNNDYNITEECINLFAKGTKYFTNGGFARLLLSEKNIGKDENDYIELLSGVYENDLKNDYKMPLIFIQKERKNYINLDLSKKALESYKSQIDFLELLKKILQLPNPVEPNKGDELSLLTIIKRDNYVITSDNFKKMILILYRINANIPVILMGETGCGKTSLINKLNQLINNGEQFVETININPSFTDKILEEKMNTINLKAKSNKEKDLWVFFDELNTCDSLVLLTEIFMNRSYNGINLEKNIKLIGACNPYRKVRKQKKKYGLQHPNQKNELIYLVKKLPQPLLYYVFNFGSIGIEDEKKYISSIISDIFGQDENELKLKELTTILISKCHENLRKENDDSIVSLREISRFKECYEFFLKTYYVHKNEYLKIKSNQNNKLERLKSIILSIYLCYYIRLTEEKSRNGFDSGILFELLNLVNYGENDNSDTLEDNYSLLSKIKEPLKSDIENEMKKNKISEFNGFSQILFIEENFLIKQINLGNGIGLNKSLRDNIFLLFVALITKIPLIIIGKPGSGKSMSVHLLYKVMKGKYSQSEFFCKFPSIMQSYIQGSYSTKPEDVENIFEIATNKLKFLIEKNVSDEDLPISMIFFDELGLAEMSENNPLKVIHSKLDYKGEYTEKNKKISFVGISNWSLDAAKINRALVLSVPDLDESIDDLKETSIKIAETFKENFKENILFKDILPTTYYRFKKFLENLKFLTAYKQFEWAYDFENIKKKCLKKAYINNDNIDEFINKKTEIIKETNYKPSWKLSNFNQIKLNPLYDKKYKEETKINLNFFGNRDFYSLIKGVAKENKNNNLNNELNIEIIEKCIERNFGGINIEIDVDTNFEFNNFEETKKILNQIEKFMSNKKKKINSIELYKIIYNNICEEKKINNMMIKTEKINEYNILKNIIDNINDSDCRFPLLQMKSSLTPLIYQNIVSKESESDNIIHFYEGSPFNDDNDIEYQTKMINIIQEHASIGNIIVLHNLEQIYPFLYDLFNMNYIKKDNKNYARICYGNNNEQLALIHENFRCIIMVDENYINKVEAPFLNRFEKMIISFDKLLNNSQKQLSDEIINDLNVKKILPFEINNYMLKELLIGCKKEDIKGLIYFLYNKDNDLNNEEYINEIKIDLFKKISKLIPQDIIINLDEKNEIKQAYYQNKKYYNLKKYFDFMQTEENSQIQISIVYTFSDVSSEIDGIEEENPILISEIKKEQQLKNSIDGTIYKNNNKNIIILHLDFLNTKKLSFLISFIKNNYINENESKYKFILIVHIKRIFKVDNPNNVKNKIYNVPDIYKNVFQLFIDDLNGKDLKFEEILNNSVNEIINDKYFDLNSKFFLTLKKFIQAKLKILKGRNTKIKKENYFENLEKLIKNEDFEGKINFCFFDLIEKIKDMLKGLKVNDLLRKIYEENYMNKKSTDILSILFDFIKDVIFENKLLTIFNGLEDNNFFTTILVLEKQENTEINYETMNEIIKNYIKYEVFQETKSYIPKFNTDFFIPGFYKFYENCSNFISINIKTDYIQNEKELRYFLNGEENEILKYFHRKELFLLNVLYREVEKNNFIINSFKDNSYKLDSNLALNDYISFHYHKYNDNYNLNISIYKEIINLLLNLRFINETEIIKNNKNDKIKIFLIKIMWIESNTNYILSILKIFSILRRNLIEENLFINMIKENLLSGKINYIVNRKKKSRAY